MEDFFEMCGPLIVIIIMVLAFIFVQVGIEYSITKNYTYEETTIIGIVEDKHTERRLLNTKPIMYRTKYFVDILVDGESIKIESESAYHIAEIGDEIILIKRDAYDKNGNFIETTYDCVNQSSQ